MDSPTIAVEILKWGMGGAVLVVIFWKFIPSLFEFLKKRDSDEQAVTQAFEAKQQAAASKQQAAVNAASIAKLQTELSEFRAAMSDLRTISEVSRAILERIERSLKNG